MEKWGSLRSLSTQELKLGLFVVVLILDFTIEPCKGFFEDAVVS